MKTENEIRNLLKEKIAFKDSFNTTELIFDGGQTRCAIMLLEWVLK